MVVIKDGLLNLPLDNEEDFKSNAIVFLKKISPWSPFDVDGFIHELSKKRVSSIALIELANALKVDPSKLYANEVDYSVIEKNLLSEDEVHLLPRYYKGSFSSTTSLSSVLSQMKHYRHSDFIMRKLQIKEKLLEEHRPLSILAVNDALNYSEHFLNNKDFEEIGYRNSEKFMHSSFGRAVSQGNTVKKAYELFVENIHLVETNWKYRVKKCLSEGLVIESRQSDHMNDLTQGEVYTNDKTTHCRLSFIKHISEHLGYQGVQVYQTSEQLSSGVFDFTVDWSQSTKRPCATLHSLQ